MEAKQLYGFLKQGIRELQEDQIKDRLHEHYLYNGQIKEFLRDINWRGITLNPQVFAAHHGRETPEFFNKYRQDNPNAPIDMRWVDTLAQQTINRNSNLLFVPGVYPLGTLDRYNLHGLDLTGIQDIATALLRCSGQNLEGARITQRQADILSGISRNFHGLIVIDADETQNPQFKELKECLEGKWEKRFNELRARQNYAPIDLSDVETIPAHPIFDLKNVTLAPSVFRNWLSADGYMAFNQYRRDNPDAVIDLAGVDLSNAGLGFNLSGLDLRKVRNLEYAGCLSGSALSGATVTPEQITALENLGQDGPTVETLDSLRVLSADVPTARIAAGGGASRDVLQDKIRGLV